MDMILLIAALVLVSIWTSRSAVAKRRNPWLWGGASFVLGIPWFHLFVVVPLIILMFLKSPQQQSATVAETTTCPKCQSASVRNTRFCTNCGWELSRVNTLDTPQELAEPTRVPSTQTQEPPEVTQAPGQGNAAKPAEAAPDSSAEAVAEPNSQPETAQPVTAQPTTAEADAKPAGDPAPEETPAPAHTYRKVIPVDAPTASAMTERGVRLFNQERIQEAIDQFTKAIALDANYIEAWAKRAEAYALLGRGDQAAEDRRRLDSLNASSS